MKAVLHMCVGLALLSLLFIGCTLEPSKMKITPRDRMEYSDPSGNVAEKPIENRYPLAILMAEADNLREEAIYKSLDATLADALSDFDFFTVAERSNLGLLQLESILSGANDGITGGVEIVEAPYLITARISNMQIEAPQVGMGRRRAIVSIDFRFYEVPSQRTIYTKLGRGESSFSYPVATTQSPGGNILGQVTAGQGQSGAAGGTQPLANIEAEERALAQAAARAALNFASDMGSRYAPPARVLETRGKGKVAMISIGSNYGVSPNTRIEFFEYKDQSDLIADATREVSPVGYGFVIQVESNRAWVNVRGNSVMVKRGHYARVSATQNMGIRDSFNKTTGMF